jgi:sugar phosphate isomerase/epimerase
MGRSTTEKHASMAKRWGFDGLELACWGDHFEVDKALEDDGYVRRVRDILEQNQLQLFAISTHLVGQCVADAIIDERHKGIISPRIWGDGDAEGVRQRAAEEVKNTARAAAALGVKLVNGFTGSPIWHTLVMFPPVPAEMIERGYAEFADRWNPILDVFDEVGVKFAWKCIPVRSPTTSGPHNVRCKLLTAAKRSASLRSQPPVLAMLDPVAFVYEFSDRIYHMHVKESIRNLDGPQRHPRLAPLLW